MKDKMFNIKKFKSVECALDYIYDTLLTTDPPMNAEFSICYSINSDECCAETVDLETMPQAIQDLLRDLDSAEGVITPVMKDSVFLFDFQTDLTQIDEYYRFPPPVRIDEVFTFAGDGLTVIHNTFACGPFTYPIIIVKTVAYEKFKDELLDRLKPGKHKGEYTENISPAIYIEVNY